MRILIRHSTMKRFLLSIFALIAALACTPDNPDGPGSGSDQGGNNSGYKPTGPITVKGVVYGGGAKTLEGVVISDGLLCVKTDKNGCFELDSDLSRTKFITMSIPSGYTAPVDENGLPQFYHRVTDAERQAKLVKHTFELYPITSNPERYTLIVGADPQPRSSGSTLDKTAYHSLDVCEDFYLDMKETAAGIKGRNVYGLMLGDIVHENMSLYNNYVEGLKTLGFPMFNILGNHDNDPNSADDTSGRHSFEEHLGPTYYSFNIGKQHYIVLDNLIMKKDANGKLKDYDQGLTPEIWQWLQNDLQYVDRSATLMVAAHSPMFMQAHMSDRSASNSNHRSDYASLLSKYNKVHAWAGHTHVTFNYNYPTSSQLKNIEVHTVARSTGELWTNEYLADGTPRGYTIVEVDGDNISWSFKPTIYQKAQYISTSTSQRLEYKYRDWDYDEDGVAKMKSNGATLSNSYQMKVYKPGEYHKNYNDLVSGAATDSKYVYVDIFLWDDKWQTPKYNGATMQKVGYKDAYSLADYEIKSHYDTYSPSLKSSEYAPGDNDLHTLFKAYETKSSGTGTVTVTDRFGNTYSSTVSW